MSDPGPLPGTTVAPHPPPRVEAREPLLGLRRPDATLGLPIGILVGLLVVYRVEDALALTVAGALGVVGMRLTGRLAGDRARMIGRLFLFAFVLRILAVFVLHYGFFESDPTLLAGDDVMNDRIGSTLAAAWREGDWVSGEWIDYRTIVGAQYFLAPGFELLPRVLNAFVGSITVVLLALASGDLFGPAAARRTGVITALFPSLILWSSLNLKEIWALLAIAILCYQIARLDRLNLKRMVPGLFLSLAILAVIRPWIMFIVATAVTIGFILTTGRGWARAPILVAVVALGVWGLWTIGAGRTEVNLVQTRTIEDIRAATATGGSAFDEAIELSGPGAVLSSAPAALGQVILGPYPWEISGLRQVFALPEVVVWYLLIPSLVRGVRRGFRMALGKTWLLLGIAIAIIVTLALLEGNLGLVFRHRLQAFIIALVFAGAGLRGMRPDVVADHRSAGLRAG